MQESIPPASFHLGPGAGFWLRRWLIWLLEGAALLTGLMVILAVALIWRLSSGPLTIDFLTNEIRDALQQAARPLQVDLSSTAIIWDSSAGRIRLSARQVSARRPGGAVIARVPEVQADVSLAALLRGRLAFRQVTLERPVIRLTRYPNGSFDVDFGTLSAADAEKTNEEANEAASEATAGEPGAQPGPALTETLETEVAEAVSNGERALALLIDMLGPAGGNLGGLSISDGVVVIRDQARGRRFVLDQAGLELRQTGTGLSVLGGVRLRQRPGGGGGLAAMAVPLEGRLFVDLVTRSLSLSLDLRHAGLATLDRLGLIAVPAAWHDLDFDARLEANFASGFQLASARARLNLVTDPRRPVSLPLGRHGMPLDRAAISLRYQAAMRTFWLERLELGLAGLSVQGHGSLYRVGGDWHFASVLSAPAIDLAAVVSRLPDDLKVPALDWARENLLGGKLSDLALYASGSAPATDWSAARLDGLVGSFDLADGSVRYQWALPVATGIRGHGDIGIDAVRLTLDQGQIEDMGISDATLLIDGFDKPVPDLDFEGQVRGPFRTVMRAFNHPRFAYADFMGLDVDALEGTVDGRLRLTLPLEAELPAEEVGVRLTGKLINGRTNPLAADLPIDKANLAMDIDGKGMKARGSVVAGGIPAKIDWHQSFSSKTRVSTAMDITADVDTGQLAALGFDPAPYLAGKAAVSARVVAYTGANVDIQATAGLDDMRLGVPSLGLAPAPIKGSLLVSLRHRRDGVTELTSASLDSDLLSFQASGQRGADGDLALRLSDARWGESEVNLSIEHKPDGQLDLVIEGPKLDLRPLLKGDDQADTPQTDPPADGEAPGWLRGGGDMVADQGATRSITYAIGEVMLAEGPPWRDVRGSTVLAARSWPLVQLQARIGKAPLSIQVDGERTDPLKLHVESENLGALLASYDVPVPVVGGHLVFEGTGSRWSRHSLELNGTVELTDFRLTDAPALARTLNVLSAQGLKSLDPNAGLPFSRFQAGIALKDGVLHIADGRASGTQFGFTTEGYLDFHHDRLSLAGTLVPVYTLNRVLGAIPVLGLLLTGGEGEGLFAATYTIDGPAGDPAVKVNPLAALAPGILRKLLFSDTPTAPGDAQDAAVRPPPKVPVAAPDHGE